MPFPNFSENRFVSRQHLDDLRMEVEENARRGGARGSLTKNPGGGAAAPLDPMPFEVEVYDDGEKAALAVRAGNVYLPGGQVIKVPEVTGLKSPAAGETQYLMLTLVRAEDGTVSYSYAWEPENTAFTEIITAQKA